MSAEDQDRDPFEQAEKRGLVVVEPKPNELFVDIDDEASEAIFQKTIDIMNRGRPDHERWTWTRSRSPSGEAYHFHVVVKMHAPVYDERVRLGLQAILGSDRIREALCWRRVDWGDHPVTVFFEKPEAVGLEPKPAAPAPSAADEADDILF